MRHARPCSPHDPRFRAEGARGRRPGRFRRPPIRGRGVRRPRETGRGARGTQPSHGDREGGKGRKAAFATAEDARAKTVEAVSHLEKVFEQRVSRTISKLGVPTVRDVRALSRQVTQLQASVDKLHRARVRAAR
ncbi:MAG: phasin family protein [Betaproteobacteria bacterium]|nr:phasin family protein [Betaproteobacteria bacterium]